MAAVSQLVHKIPRVQRCQCQSSVSPLRPCTHDPGLAVNKLETFQKVSFGKHALMCYVWACLVYKPEWKCFKSFFD